MRNWKPQPSLRAVSALFFALVALIAALWSGAELAAAVALPPAEWPVDRDLFVRLIALIGASGSLLYLTYRAVGGLTLNYELDRNGLYIVWGGNRATLPLTRIEKIEIGLPSVVPPLALFASSIGYFRGRLTALDGRTVLLYASRPPAECLAITTDEAIYMISPTDAENFVQDLEQRRRLGAIQALVPSIQRGRLFAYGFWADPTARLALIAALVANLIVFGMAMLPYPELAATIALRFDASGNLAELRPRHQILFLPLAALGIALINAALGFFLHRKNPLGTRLLQFGSILIQILFAVAVATALAGA